MHVIASGVTSEKAVVLTSKAGHFKTLRELTECMRASMLLPGITGPMVRDGWLPCMASTRLASKGGLLEYLVAFIFLSGVEWALQQ